MDFRCQMMLYASSSISVYTVGSISMRTGARAVANNIYEYFNDALTRLFCGKCLIRHGQRGRG